LSLNLLSLNFIVFIRIFQITYIFHIANEFARNKLVSFRPFLFFIQIFVEKKEVAGARLKAMNENETEGKNFQQKYVSLNKEFETFKYGYLYFFCLKQGCRNKNFKADHIKKI
jgi:hypothetical protein